MTAPDLTAAEAIAEVEAFLGEGWQVDAHAANDPCLAGVRAWWHSDALVGLHSDATTLRAAVDALFQAWRDAVRPWVELSVKEGFIGGRRSTAVMGGRQTLNEKAAIVERIMSRNVVLGEEA